MALQDIIFATGTVVISMILYQEKAFDDYPLIEQNNVYVRTLMNIIVCGYCIMTAIFSFVNLLTYDFSGYQNFMSKFRMIFAFPYLIYSIAFAVFYLFSLQTITNALTKTNISAFDKLFEDLEWNPMAELNKNNLGRVKVYFVLLGVFVLLNVFMFSNSIAYASTKYGKKSLKTSLRRNSIKR